MQKHAETIHELTNLNHSNDKSGARSANRVNKILTGSPYAIEGNDLIPHLKQVIDSNKDVQFGISTHTSRISSAVTAETMKPQGFQNLIPKSTVKSKEKNN